MQRPVVYPDNILVMHKTVSLSRRKMVIQGVIYSYASVTFRCLRCEIVVLTRIFSGARTGSRRLRASVTGSWSRTTTTRSAARSGRASWSRR